MTDKAHDQLLDARARLSRAMETLEARLTGMADQMGELDAAQAKIAALKSEKADLAEQVQKAMAKEAEFADLAAETTQELDAAIAEVRKALGE